MAKLHRPKKGEIFNLGLSGIRCQVVKVKENIVTYKRISDNEQNFFLLNSLTHRFSIWKNE